MKKNNKKLKILLTGSSGFLGSYLVKNIRNIDFDFFDRKSSLIMDKNISVDGIIHCAGLAHNSHDKRLRGEYMSANVNLTKRILKILEESKAEFLIFISTSKIYEGITDNTVLTEEMVGKKLSVYAESKLLAEQIILKSTKKKFFILRPSVIVGPNPKGNILLLEKLIKLKLPIPIPRKSSKINLTDIRNISYLINHLCDNYKKIDSGVYNINDNIRPNFNQLLEKLAITKKTRVRTIKIPNSFFKLGINIIKITNSNLSSKLESLFFDDKKISNNKINNITPLSKNSFEL